MTVGQVENLCSLVDQYRSIAADKDKGDPII